MQIISALIAIISSAICRPYPNFTADVSASDEELAKNRLQIRNLLTLKYREQPGHFYLVDFFVEKCGKPCSRPKSSTPPLLSPFRAAFSPCQRRVLRTKPAIAPTLFSWVWAWNLPCLNNIFSCLYNIPLWSKFFEPLKNPNLATLRVSANPWVPEWSFGLV